MSSVSNRMILLLWWICFFCYNCDAFATGLPPKVFNVINYGARPGGFSDNSQLSNFFLKAWKDGCEYEGKSRILIPKGTYEMNSVTFAGPCKGAMSFLIKGTLLAPTNPALFLNYDTWIGFKYLDNLTVKGGGVLDGRGKSAWKYNNCGFKRNCYRLPTTLRLDFVHNSKIKYLRSVNSKIEHISVFGSTNLNISFLKLTTPNEGHNTDGIKIARSKNIWVSRSMIHTGDDCIALLSGSEEIGIKEVVCGPGHGISIGSIGRGHWKDPVRGVRVMNCTFLGTQNGARIKTWSPSEYVLVADVSFEDIKMENVNNPIFIDQDYCPFCGNRKIGSSQSQVEIRNVTFRNIRGTSSSKIAVNLQCSNVKPCQNVKFVNIDLAYEGPIGGPSLASCFNVYGVAYGKQVPSGCVV
ncbi:OLC1v1036333C2 [Oldenlandia corymbosa var. corymbosa]|uniref:OLC1v1036333C2 n=1 Tax=Oldenlandia corymbosa var. corymbosa TaxID=529605 RepID=A0AAV1CVS3_OLDCO|nr:OLC1v1036333C2 [Oldenlandia corymbosa var. corymbosa]